MFSSYILSFFSSYFFFFFSSYFFRHCFFFAAIFFFLFLLPFFLGAIFFFFFWCCFHFFATATSVFFCTRFGKWQGFFVSESQTKWLTVQVLCRKILTSKEGHWLTLYLLQDVIHLDVFTNSSYAWGCLLIIFTRNTSAKLRNRYFCHLNLERIQSQNW